MKRIVMFIIGLYLALGTPVFANDDNELFKEAIKELPDDKRKIYWQKLKQEGQATSDLYKPFIEHLSEEQQEELFKLMQKAMFEGGTDQDFLNYHNKAVEYKISDPAKLFAYYEEGLKTLGKMRLFLEANGMLDEEKQD